MQTVNVPLFEATVSETQTRTLEDSGLLSLPGPTTNPGWAFWVWGRRSPGSAGRCSLIGEMSVMLGPLIDQTERLEGVGVFLAHSSLAAPVQSAAPPPSVS